MRLYTTSTIQIKIRFCAECPAHEKVMLRKRVPFGATDRWISEPDHVICKKTARRIGMSGIDPQCPLPEYHPENGAGISSDTAGMECANG